MSDSSPIVFSQAFPPPPARLFLVGIGGIGMSGLAQFLKHQGYQVAGSDRGWQEPSRQFLFRALERQGIAVFPQDGSGPRAFQPDGFIFTTAIEPGNPDALAMPRLPVFHRALALSRLCAQTGGTLVGVAGTCGKTTVTGWLGSALRRLGHSLVLVNGGYLPEWETPDTPGNFYATPQTTRPRFTVVEIDESDRSIREFAPDYGVVLNVGDDHYSTEELVQVFQHFLGRCRKGALRPEALPELEGPDAAATFHTFPGEPGGYHADARGISFQGPEGTPLRSRLSGRHNALNGMAVYQLLRMALPETSPEEIGEAMAGFQGVRQRFEVFPTPAGAPGIVNDYAHNPEKIFAAISTARERFGSPLGIVFQPHGFGALRFMEEPLRDQLKACLSPGDRLLLLPVYYAGGTVEFSPTSQEVAQRFAREGIPATFLEDRRQAEHALRQTPFHAWLVLGARDASLREWTRELAQTWTPQTEE
ncbi:MAG: Mur ligase domain-containing protein [Oligosphaeraceae bacterium]